MKLFVNCAACREKIYLTFDNHIHDRNNISPSFSVICSNCGTKEIFANRSVIAEENGLDAPAGAILGGLIGLVLGPEGGLIGAGLGSLAGANAKENDNKAVRRFNRS